MPLAKEIKDAVYLYCNNHLADEAWYNEEFEFIEDEPLRKRLVEEFKGIRFAYKLYEGIEAKDENLILKFVIRYFRMQLYTKPLFILCYTLITKILRNFINCNTTLCLPELIFQKQN